jgi:NADH-quinone oxidoreductase subunit I
MAKNGGVAGFFKKLLMLEILKGMALTMKYNLAVARPGKPKDLYTEEYPKERPKVAERYRGAPRLNINPETGDTLCIGCNLCALACPEHLIVVTTARDEQTNKKVLTTFTYDTSRCMFCGLCEDACPVEALELSQDFELASYTREGAIWDRQMLEEGPRPTPYAY